jgi:predicted RNA binding protein YcfA (HicA-like mRNA interferase family)
LTETLPLLSGRKVAQAFVRLGWQVARQKGSHIVLVKPGHIASLSVPDHREVARGTLRGLPIKNVLLLDRLREVEKLGRKDQEMIVELIDSVVARRRVEAPVRCTA